MMIIPSRLILSIFGNVSSFRKSDNNSIDLDVNGKHLPQPREVAEAFADYKSVFNNRYLRDSSSASQSSDSLSLASVS
jgi:hypothetical protein